MSIADTKTLRAIAFVGSGLSIYSLAWRSLVDGMSRFAQAAAEWHDEVGGRWPIASVVVICMILAAAIVVAQQSRNVRTLKGGLIVGLLVAVVAIPPSIGTGYSAGIGGYVALRGCLVGLGLVGSSIAAVALRT